MKAEIDWAARREEKRIESAYLREELETAWLRGFGACARGANGDAKETAQEAADYAERVVGGSTRPERPEID